MVAGMLHDLAFVIFQVVCNGIQIDHVVCILTLWYAFSKPHKTSIYDI